MKTIKYKEPKSLLEVRAVKRKLSMEIEKLGWEGFHKKYRPKIKSIMADIEKHRLEKLAKASPYLRSKSPTPAAARERKTAYKTKN